LIINFIPFPYLSTERLTLRRMTFEDVDEIFFLRSDPEILKYLSIQKTETVDDALKYIDKINKGINANEWILWAICLKNSDRLIGTICLWNISFENSKADVGYVLHPAFQGMGIMQEALLKIIDYGFEQMNLSCIDADVDPENSKSIKLLKINGFTLTKSSHNTFIYSLVNNTLHPKSLA
jgi:[ribosomal protein S5]-alanine N-acetyltransferase